MSRRSGSGPSCPPPFAKGSQTAAPADGGSRAPFDELDDQIHAVDRFDDRDFNPLASGGEFAGMPASVSVSYYLNNMAALDASGGFDISDVAANVATQLDVLNADPNIESITLTDGGTPALALSIDQALGDTTALDKIVSAYSIAISDSAAVASLDLDALNGLAKISSITLTDTGAPSLSLHAFQALNDTIALGKITNTNYTIKVVDVAVSISADLTALDADAKVTSIIVEDNASLVLSLDAWEHDSVAVGELRNADGSPVAYVISDTAANVLANLSQLQTAGAEIASIDATNGPVVVSTDSFDKYQTTLDKIEKGFVVSDTSADVLADLAPLDADIVNIVEVEVTDGAPQVDVKTFVADQALLDIVVGGFVIVDTAADIVSALDKINADADAISITRSDSAALQLTAAQVGDDASALQRIRNASGKTIHFDVVDSAGAIETGLTALEAAGAQLLAITSNSGVATFDIAALATGAATLNKIVGGFALRGAGEQLLGDIAAIEEEGAHVTALIATDGPVTVNGATFVADESVLNLFVGGFDVAASAANIEADLAALTADASNIASIQIKSGGPISVSAETFATDKAALVKISGGFDVADTAAAIEAAIAPLARHSADIDAISLTSGVVLVSEAVFGEDRSALDLIAGGFRVFGDSLVVTGALAALEADTSHIDRIKLEGVGTQTLTLTSAMASEYSDLLGKLATGYVLDVTSAGSNVITGHGSGLTIADVAGEDTISGAAANDTFTFGEHFGDATLVDFSNFASGATHATLQFSKAEFASFHALKLDAALGASSVVITHDGDTLTLDGLTLTTLKADAADFVFK